MNARQSFGELKAPPSMWELIIFKGLQNVTAVFLLTVFFSRFFSILLKLCLKTAPSNRVPVLKHCSPDQGCSADYKQFKQKLGSRAVWKIYIAFACPVLPRCDAEYLVQRQHSEGGGKIPGPGRDAVIQRVRGIYCGWVIKVLVFPKEK